MATSSTGNDACVNAPGICTCRKTPCRLNREDNEMYTVQEDGYTWVVFPDDAWERAEFMEWFEGIPWYVKNYS